jgi:transposase-like protein
VFAEAKSCAENYLTKTTTEFSKKHYGIEYEFIKLYESLLIPNPSKKRLIYIFS